MARTKKEEVKAPKAKAPKEDKAVKGLTDNPKAVTLKGEVTPEVKEAFAEVFPEGKDESTVYKEWVEEAKKELIKAFEAPTQEDKFKLVKKIESHSISPESFLISKGIDPPMKDSPLNGQNSITFNQLCELLNEFKNA